MSDSAITLDPADVAAATREQAERVLSLIGSEELYPLFAEDVVIEFPYGPSLGMPDRFEGKTAAVAYVREMVKLLPGLKMHDVTYYPIAGDPETVIMEYLGDAPTPGGNTYVQSYVNRMRFRDGKMVYMREIWDPKRILDARSGLYDRDAA
jgi:ketosteroid isomerase-like protein